MRSERFGALDAFALATGVAALVVSIGSTPGRDLARHRPSSLLSAGCTRSPLDRADGAAAAAAIGVGVAHQPLVDDRDQPARDRLARSVRDRRAGPRPLRRERRADPGRRRRPGDGSTRRPGWPTARVSEPRSPGCSCRRTLPDGDWATFGAPPPRCRRRRCRWRPATRRTAGLRHDRTAWARCSSRPVPGSRPLRRGRGSPSVESGCSLSPRWSSAPNVRSSRSESTATASRSSSRSARSSSDGRITRSGRRTPRRAGSCAGTSIASAAVSAEPMSAA